jgi:hypothetical protein
MSNTKTRADLTVNGHKLEEVDSFTYLGSEIDNLGGSDKEVNIRIGKSRTAFNMMGSIWKSRDISLKTKVRLFNSNVKTILLYGSETWKTTKSLLHKLQVIINNCLRCLLNIRWPEKIYNKELWQKTNQPPAEEELKRRKWRKPKHNITRQALQWNPRRKRGRGRPRNTWRRDFNAEMEIEGYRWQDLERIAQNRTRWRTVVSGLCTTKVQQA